MEHIIGTVIAVKEVIRLTFKTVFDTMRRERRKDVIKNEPPSSLGNIK